jgi:4'-phosphopantetheinyl transferase
MQPAHPVERPGASIGHADAWIAVPARATGWQDRLDTLDTEERRRRAEIVEPGTARAYAVLHLLARHALGQVLGTEPSLLRFDRTCGRCGLQHGPPRVVGHAGLHVSLSRTRELVAVAVSTDAPVGIDVEQISDTGFEGFDAVATHPSERWADLDDRDRALSWVRKEAALKALGVGFVVDPSTLTTPQPGRPAVVVPGRPAVSIADVPLCDDIDLRAVDDARRAGGHVAALGLAAAYDAVRVTVHPPADAP